MPSGGLAFLGWGRGVNPLLWFESPEMNGFIGFGFDDRRGFRDRADCSCRVFLRVGFSGFNWIVVGVERGHLGVHFCQVMGEALIQFRCLIVRFDRLCQSSLSISSIIRCTAKELCASRWGSSGF